MFFAVALGLPDSLFALPSLIPDAISMPQLTGVYASLPRTGFLQPRPPLPRRRDSSVTGSGSATSVIATPLPALIRDRNSGVPHRLHPVKRKSANRIDFTSEPAADVELPDANVFYVQSIFQATPDNSTAT